MFEALSSAKSANKYQVAWLDKSQGEFTTQMTIWLNQLSSSRVFGSGPSKTERKALADEFWNLLLIYKELVEEKTGLGESSPALDDAEAKISKFFNLYRGKFGEVLNWMGPTIPFGLKEATRDLEINAQKRDVMVRKKQVVKFWLKGVREFNDHLEDVSLTLQYLGNAEPSKVRLFLDVLVKDADNIIKMEDPRPWLKTERELKAGGEREAKVEWTNDDFKKAVKAEASASYGVSASGECAIELTGFKAELKAEAFAGAKVSAEAGVSHGVGEGLKAGASVEAMIGVQIKAEANIDVADIFLIENSAEAFAGAMAKAEVEITATVDGVAFKLEAEAFAGVRAKASTGLTLRMCGYDIIKGEAEVSISAGVGAAFKFSVESSAFGGTSMEIGAEATVGIGGGASSSFTVYADNLPRVANSIYYTAYLTILGETKKRYAWKTYFRPLEDNEILFKKADEIIDRGMETIFMKHVEIFNRLSAWNQLQGLSIFQMPTQRTIPVITAGTTRPRSNAMIGKRPVMRPRRGAISGRIDPADL